MKNLTLISVSITPHVQPVCILCFIALSEVATGLYFVCPNLECEVLIILTITTALIARLGAMLNDSTGSSITPSVPPDLSLGVVVWVDNPITGYVFTCNDFEFECLIITT